MSTAPAPVSPETSTDIVTADDLRKTYRISRPPREVLRGVSLRIRGGEFVAIMGASGSGKSTLLYTLGGLEPPDGGAARIRGVDMYALTDTARSAFRRDHIGFVFQSFNLMPSLTAAENVALPLRLRNDSPLALGGSRVSRRDINDRVRALMDQLNLHGLQGHGPDEISGGEQQRVAIARALVAAPALLLADEPTGNLDWTSGHEVMGLLSRLARSEGQTTVVVTHDARVAAYADRVLVMSDGTIVDEVTLEHRPSRPDAIPDPAALVARLSKLHL
ncbi:MAG: ABC transporter ATP-binding protein [Candidatus Dormibacteraeota bacterium]|nr:ABC transporter ATP-binding protein [Candidatus Dormibacteraeota bacterium]